MHAQDLDREAQRQVERWLQHMGAVVRADYQHPRRTDNRNNHAYRAGMSVAAVGLRRMTGDFLIGVSNNTGWVFHKSRTMGRCRWNSPGEVGRCTISSMPSLLW
jgi:Alginate lyase